MSEEQMNETEDATKKETLQEAEQPTRLPGAELLARREQLGWTVEEAAERMKMAPRQISALEADDFAALPGVAVTRGFVRAYAKALKLDTEPLVALLRDEKESENKKRNLTRPARPVALVTYYDSRMPSLGNRNPASKRWFIAVLLVAVLIAALLLGRRMGWLPNVSRLPVLKKETVEVSVSAEVDRSQKKKTAVVAGITANRERLIQKELPPVMPIEVLPAVDERGVKHVRVAAGKKTTKPENLLVLSCREQSWYEFRRPDGLVLKSGLLHAGASKSFTIDQPMQLTLGNAPGVAATFGGERLEIKPKKGSKLFKLNLK